MTRLHDLDAYLTRELSEREADVLEEALFDAPEDPDLLFFDRIARHGARLVEHGTFDMGVSKAHVDALIAAGKKKIVALTACMRKLLVILNQMVKTRTMWDPDFGRPAAGKTA